MSEYVTWKVLCYVVPDYKNRAAEELDAVIAAAEERGRRRGVEERDELRALVVDLRYWITARVVPAPQVAAKLLARIGAALSPRLGAAKHITRRGSGRNVR